MRAESGLVCLVGLTACVGGGAAPSAGSAGRGDDGGITYVRGAAAGGRAAGAAAISGGSAQQEAGSGGTPAVPAADGGSGPADAGSGGASPMPAAGAGSAAGNGGSTAHASASAGARDSHFPLASGAHWTYHHSGGPKAAWDETDTMLATTYQGKAAFLLEDQEDAQGAQTHSTLVVQGTGVYRTYKEVTIGGQTALTVRYDPAFLRYDEAWLTDQQQVTLDDAWVQTCVFSSVAKTCAAGAVKTGTTTHQFTVLSASTSVSVPAGTFDAVEIQRVDPNTSEIKRYWFARGVGKVRDEAPATGEITELTGYTIP